MSLPYRSQSLPAVQLRLSIDRYQSLASPTVVTWCGNHVLVVLKASRSASVRTAPKLATGYIIEDLSVECGTHRQWPISCITTLVTISSAHGSNKDTSNQMVQRGAVATVAWPTRGRGRSSTRTGVGSPPIPQANIAASRISASMEK